MELAYAAGIMMRVLADVCIVLLVLGVLLVCYEAIAGGTGLPSLIGVFRSAWVDFAPSAKSALSGSQKWLAAGLAVFIIAVFVLIRIPRLGKY